MKILIVDDDQKNLEAAKEAAKSWAHEFEFINSAKKAEKIMASYDALITDFFFPVEKNFGLSYSIPSIDSPITQKVIGEYYSFHREEAELAYESVSDFLKTGSLESTITRLLHLPHLANISEIEKESYLRAAKHPPQFPYGGALMLRARQLKKAMCLVSDIHRHAGAFLSPTTALDGIILLIPLIAAEILTIEQAREDGEGSKVFMGWTELKKFGNNKKSPAVWIEAIKRVVS